MKAYLLLALAAALTMAGCAQGTASAPPAAGTTPPSAQTPAPAETPVPPEAQWDWGITLTAEDVTPAGLTLTCTQSGGSPTGRLQTGSYYSLEAQEGENWVSVEALPHDFEVGWTDEAWLIPMEDTVQWTVDWEWLYGPLPAGTYRLGKEIIDFRDSGDFDKQMAYAQFTIS